MSALGVPNAQISLYTNVALRSVQHILQVYKNTGKYGAANKPGRRRKLEPDDIKVCPNEPYSDDF